MTACSGISSRALRFRGREASSRTLLLASSAAESSGHRMREGRLFECLHRRGDMITRAICRHRFLSGDDTCRPGDTPCALGLLVSGEAA